jgi:hypothetical protein
MEAKRRPIVGSHRASWPVVDNQSRISIPNRKDSVARPFAPYSILLAFGSRHRSMQHARNHSNLHIGAAIATTRPASQIGKQEPKQPW